MIYGLCTHLFCLCCDRLQGSVSTSTNRSMFHKTANRYPAALVFRCLQACLGYVHICPVSRHPVLEENNFRKHESFMW